MCAREPGRAQSVRLIEVDKVETAAGALPASEQPADRASSQKSQCESGYLYGGQRFGARAHRKRRIFRREQRDIVTGSAHAAQGEKRLALAAAPFLDRKST